MGHIHTRLGIAVLAFSYQTRRPIDGRSQGQATAWCDRLPHRIAEKLPPPRVYGGKRPLQQACEYCHRSYDCMPCGWGLFEAGLGTSKARRFHSISLTHTLSLSTRDSRALRRKGRQYTHGEPGWDTRGTSGNIRIWLFVLELGVSSPACLPASCQTIS